MRLNDWKRQAEEYRDIDREAQRKAEAALEKRTVTIPACVQHEGFYSMTVTLPWVCLHCGEPRGEPYDVLSYDGSRRLNVHGWKNACGHVEKYAEVRDSLEKP